MDSLFINGNDLLTIKEVAKILRVREKTVRNYVKRKMLPAVTLPHDNKYRIYRIRRSTLNTVLQAS